MADMICHKIYELLMSISTNYTFSPNFFHAGMREYFHSHCEGLMSWLDDQSSNSFAAFIEGWALYSENPVMSDDTDVYNDNPMQKYGMFKWQVGRDIFQCLLPLLVLMRG